MMSAAWDIDGAPNTPRIAILCPYMTDTTMQWFNQTWMPLQIGIPGIEKVVLTSNTYGISHSRNTLAKQALDLGCTHLFWIDSDMFFEGIDPNAAIVNMLATKYPIVSGLYRAKKPPHWEYAAWKARDEGYEPIGSWDGNWFEVDVVGFGCVLIERKVFDDVRKKIGDSELFFRYDGMDVNTLSEDFYFLKLAEKVGYKPRVLSDIKLSHAGRYKVHTDGTFSTDK